MTHLRSGASASMAVTDDAMAGLTVAYDLSTATRVVAGGPAGGYRPNERGIKMSGIGHVNGPDSINRLAATRPVTAPAGDSASTNSVAEGDQVELSQFGSMMSTLQAMPDIRIDKVNAVRAAIERGDYETDEKLDGTIDEMLKDPDALGSVEP